MLKVKPVALAIGTVVVASFGAGINANASDVFATTDLAQGYNVLAAAEGEGKCGEGKCGEGKCGEGTDAAAAGGEAESAAEGEATEEGKDGEGKCGEGKCGGNG